MRPTASATVAAIAAGVLLAGPAAWSADPAHALRQGTAGGIVFHYGVVPAEIVRRHPADHPERAMHGGSDTDSHIILALFDSVSGTRISEARIEATVELLGGAAVRKPMEPMTVAGSASFGNYFALAVPGVYRIRFVVTRPGAAPAAADFEYRVAPPPRRR